MNLDLIFVHNGRRLRAGRMTDEEYEENSQGLLLTFLDRRTDTLIFPSPSTAVTPFSGPLADLVASPPQVSK